MAVSPKMFLERPTGAMKTDAKCPRRDPEDRRGVLGGKAVPGDEPEGFWLALRKLRERPVDLRTVACRSAGSRPATSGLGTTDGPTAGPDDARISGASKSSASKRRRATAVPGPGSRRGVARQPGTCRPARPRSRPAPQRVGARRRIALGGGGRRAPRTRRRRRAARTNSSPAYGHLPSEVTRLAFSTIRMRPPPCGTIVTPRRARGASSASRGADRTVRRIVASATLISSSASAEPMQRCAPPPNGSQV